MLPLLPRKISRGSWNTGRKDKQLWEACTEAELTAQEGHGPQGLLHEDLGDRGQVVVRVV